MQWLLSQLKKHWRQFFFIHNTRWQWVFLLFFITVVTFGFFDFAHAQGASFTTDVANGLLQFFSEIFLKLAEWILKLVAFILEFFINIAAYNNFSQATPVILGWFMVRDLANMFFVVALLAIAFGTILGIEQYEWKKSLGKLVIAAILVNFSRLIAQLIIDGAHVFTITFLNAIAGTAGGNVINMFSLDALFKILPSQNSQATELRLDVFIASLTILIFTSMVLVALGVYFIILLARMVVLWVLIIMSPMAYVMQAIPQTKAYAQEYWKEFINHVIVAPIMVFFLWLAFASFGAGTIAQEIGVGFGSDSKVVKIGNSDLIGKRPPGLEASPNVSITEAGTWENMANFLIALAFLVVGVERVQKLGVKGAGLTNQVTKFGKWVAAVGSGYVVGRAAYEGGKDLTKKAIKKGAKEGFRRLPLVGGAALKEYAAAIKADYHQKGFLRTGIGGIKSKEKRAQYAKHMEQHGGKLGWVASRLFEPSERKEKRAENWDESVESAEKKFLDNLGTSKSASGQAKLNESILLDFQYAMGKAKKEQKIQDRISDYVKVNDEFKAIYDKNKAKVDSEERNRIAQISDPEKQKKELKRYESAAGQAELETHVLNTSKDEFMKSTKDKNIAEKALNIFGPGGLQGITISSKARSASKRETFEDIEALDVAEARAKEYEKNGETLRADSIRKRAASEKTKKYNELYSTLGFSESLANGALIVENIKSDRNQLARESDPDKKEKIQKDINTSVRQSVALLTAATGSDSETGFSTLDSMLKKANWDENITEDNRLRAVVSALTGKKVDQANIGAAVAELENAYEGNINELNAAMSALGKSFKAVSGDAAGGVFAGLIDEATGEGGRVVYGFGKNLGTGDKKGRPYSPGTQRQFVSDNEESTFGYFNARMDMRKVTGAAQLGTTIFDPSDANRDGKLGGFSINQAKAFGKIFKGKNSNQIAGFNEAFWDSLNVAVVDDTNYQSYIYALDKVNKALGNDTNAKEKVESNISGLINKIKQTANGRSAGAGDAFARNVFS